MNIKMQIAGLIVLLTLCLNMSKHRIKIKTTSAFIALLVNTAILLLLDISSLICIVYNTSDQALFTEIIAKFYLLTLVYECILTFIYVLDDVTEYHKQYKSYKPFLYISTLLISLIILASPISWYKSVDNRLAYTYGVAPIFTYIFSFTFLIATIVLLLLNKHNMQRRRYEAVLIWMGIWVIAAIIQLIWKEVLLVGFIGSIGILILYIRLENPDKFIETDTGYFNHQAFTEYLKQLYTNDTEVSLLIISATNMYHGEDTNIVERREIRKSFLQFLSTLCNTIFLYESGIFIMSFRTTADCNSALYKITSRIQNEWGTHGVILHPSLYTMYNILSLNTENKFSSILNYAISISNHTISYNYFDINKELINKYNHEVGIIDMLHRSIEEDTIEVFYQPIYSTSKQCFVSAEALIRIRDKQGNIIPPNEFIDIAEKNSIIMKLGRIVFQKVCEFISENNLEALDINYIDTNLSMIQCGYDQLASDYKSIMEAYGINPLNINLEITESASLESKKILLRNMNNLMKMGVKFSLDDFGTGQSNLNYIIDMPVNIVKFDKTMTNAYFNNKKAKYIMDAAIHMIKGLELKIVAEGIETEQQLLEMEHLGIDYIQGYYFSKPLPEKEFIEFIIQHHTNKEENTNETKSNTSH